MNNKNLGPILIVATIVVGLFAIIGLAVANQGKPTSAEQDLIDIAESLGMDGDKFFEDYKSEEVKNIIEEDRQKADDKGVDSTPSIFVNEQRVSATQTYEQFKQMIGEQIAAATIENPVKIEIFEDYQCPFCSEFFPFTYQLEAEFGEIIEVERMNFPLESIHQYAMTYAKGVEAAKIQGNYFAMAKAIFEKENEGIDYSVLDSLNIDAAGNVEKTNLE